MARMQSTQSQCCCCSISVFSALFGIIMLSTGVCLVLNYRIMEVDTTGLPPQWQNEEGKKIVGIILICCGLGGMGVSAIVTALYFTVCSRSKTTTSVAPSEQGAVQTVDKTHHQSQSSDPYSTEVSNKHHTQTKTSSSRHGKRSKKKRLPPHLKSYKTRLTPHQEVINESEARHEHVDLDESSRSLDSSQTSSSKTISNSGDRKEGDAPDIAETSLQTSAPSPQPPPAADSQPVPPPPHASPPPVRQPVILNPNELAKLSSQDLLKTVPPPPIPATPLQEANDEEEEEEEEEEVSQIEEIKKLDKDVANLLV